MATFLTGTTFGANISETDKAYIAGLLDGEGSIGMFICNQKQLLTPTYYLQVSITNTHKGVLVWLTALLGVGRLSEKLHGNKRWKRSYNWRLSGFAAGKFLECVYPYLRIKRLQAEIGIKYTPTLQKYTQRHRLTLQERHQREQLYREMKRLNLKGDKAFPPTRRAYDLEAI